MRGGEVYDESYFTERHKQWFGTPNTRLFKMITDSITRQCPQKTLSIFDIGCGDGSFLRFVDKHLRYSKDLTLTGNDVAKLFDDPNISFIQGDFCTAVLENRFDVIVSLGVIEHIENHLTCMKRISELLALGGVVYIMTIDTGNIMYRTARLLRFIGLRDAFEQLYDHAHLHHYNKHTFSVLLEKCGFEILKTVSHDFPMKSVDVPERNPFLKLAYLLFVQIIFSLNAFFGSGMLQTVLCKKKV